MGCCVSKEADPVLRLANAAPLSQKTLTFSKPMPHQQRIQRETEDTSSQSEVLVEHDPASDTEESHDESMDEGGSHFEAQQYVAPGSDGSASRALNAPPLIPCSGFLMKEPLHLKGRPKEIALKRKKRFFHLRATVLLYYKEQCDDKGLCSDGSKAKLKGGLKLAAGVSTVKLQGRRITVTGLNTRDEEASLYVFVKSSEDGDRWVRAISRAIDHLEALAQQDDSSEGVDGETDDDAASEDSARQTDESEGER